MAIEELTNQLKALKGQGPADLELSEAARDTYVRLIKDYRRELKAQRDKVAGLQELGCPGTIPSAEQTRDRLVLNVINVKGMLRTLDKCMDYLDAHEDVANAAFKRMQAET